MKFAGWIEKEYKIVGAEILDECLPFNELKVLTSFSANIKKEFPVELEVICLLFSLLRSTTPLPAKTNHGRRP